MHMHDTPSTNCGFTEPSPIFPYRPRPKATKQIAQPATETSCL